MIRNREIAFFNPFWPDKRNISNKISTEPAATFVERNKERYVIKLAQSISNTVINGVLYLNRMFVVI